MNKIIVQKGLLVFFLGVLFFARMELSLQDILIRPIVASLALAILLSVIAIMFLKSANKMSSGINNEFSENPSVPAKPGGHQLGNNYG